MLPKAKAMLLGHGSEVPSRNGPVIQLFEPVILEYLKPTERVLLYSERDCNPFFHLFEFLWMLAGRNDLASLQFFNSGMANYSDDGKTLNGAYGYRWRKHFNRDQLDMVIEALKKNPGCRRQVLSMWDARRDLGLDSKDLPCNIAVTFDGSSGLLNMTVFNRSNDLVWGALGADCVHFSLLHEYVARCIHMPLGRYFQVSSNFHAYLATIDKAPTKATRDPYEERRIDVSYPLLVNKMCFDAEVAMITDLHTSTYGWREPFIRRIVMPMIEAYKAFKDTNNPNRFKNALQYIETMPVCSDWATASREWLMRREMKTHEHKN